MPRKSTTLLAILDGWGLGESTPCNALLAARTPVWDRLVASSAWTTLAASGGSVGLPGCQMGNSEVGHLNLGAGRVVHQDLTRIDHAVASGAFARNSILNDALEAAGDGALHILGLLSPGGVHSHEAQIAALIDLAARRGVGTVRLHAFLDGRDTPPKSAAQSLERIEQRHPGVIASICGRYYAMDRDRRWERTERAYNLVQRGEAPFHFRTPAEALDAAYARGESDEFVQPTAVHPEGELPAKFAGGDAAVFMNFRADRARQLAHAIRSDGFAGFERRSRAELAAFATLTRYADDLDAPAAFPPLELRDTLGEWLAKRGLTQLRVAETEKYAHVTYFFSGGREQPFPGEDRILVPSPQVATYDLAPEMSAAAVTDHLVSAIREGRHDLIVVNYANGDMVGHTGVFDAAVQAVETVDGCLGRLLDALDRHGGQCLITADHGNVERMRDADSGQAHTAHTTSPVPLIYAGPRDVRFAGAGAGALCDVAPTLLSLMDIPRPAAMTGRALAQPARAVSGA